MKNFDPSAPAAEDSGLFGLPTDYESAKLAILPAPWEVTTSYGAGTASAPQAILKASHQVDLFNRLFAKAYESGFFMMDYPQELFAKNVKMKKLAQTEEQLEQVNQACEEFNRHIYVQSQKVLRDGKFCAVLGGDHSTPFGLIQAIGEKYKRDYSILHFDAHHDLRQAYQGFTHSHASIFYNVMESSFAPKKLVQVGIRDFCEEEFLYARDNQRIHCYYDHDLAADLFKGKSWQHICDEIVSHLSDNVYVSVDIDGLSPDLCPNTGTPVPGGLSFQQFDFLLERLANKQKKIIGFDLVEVAPDPQNISEWDANIGARVLFHLCGWLIKTQN